jgi:hypothetical protein
LTTGSLFKELRILLNVVSRFIITRFPRMKGNFSPGKSILRDMVQILMLTLIFYPVSALFQAIPYRGYLLLHTVSLIFIVLTMIFIYDITKNAVRIISNQFSIMTRSIISSNAAREFELQAESAEI